MPCYHPLTGYRSRTTNSSTGKRNIVFNLQDGFKDQPVELPCGQCIGCRLERSRQWAIRCVHEASLYRNNCFITLTYNDDNLPPNQSLVKKDFQDFMKRLRKSLPQKIRVYYCGEYGENFGRPHYHACIFGHDFSDKLLKKENANGDNLYVSQKLEKLWGKGHCLIGNVTFESAAYVARYLMKKVTGKKADAHYNKIDLATGEIFERLPEFTNMSKSIGKAWFEKYSSDIYPDDFIVLRNKKLKPPKFYNARYELAYPEDYAKIKIARVRAAKKHSDNNTRDRLDVREYIQLEKANQLKRTIT